MYRPLHIASLAAFFPLAFSLAAQQQPNPLAPYIKEDATVLVLEHVTLIDGTGSAPQPDMRIVIAGRKIIAVQPANPSSPLPPDAKVLDLTGKTVIPGIVGMHEHLFYPLPDRPDAGNAIYGEMADVRWPTARRASIWPAASPRRAPLEAWSPTPTSSSRNRSTRDSPPVPSSM
jgi:hypothetical protein